VAAPCLLRVSLALFDLEIDESSDDKKDKGYCKQSSDFHGWNPFWSGFVGDFESCWFYG
jgi:hypothetical protein